MSAKVPKFFAKKIQFLLIESPASEDITVPLLQKNFFLFQKFYLKKRLAGCLLRAGYSNFSLRDVHRLFFFYGVLPVKVSLRLGRVLAAVRRQIKGGGIILAARNIF